MGGVGFIGSNIAEYLISEGNFVRALDDFSSGAEENLKFAEGLSADKFELIRGDIRDKGTCR
ncbi:MAG: GDP-mannose 4,6-dehydratase [Candidatus Zapsychrus exili]|nr:GDP-mannose 4,6-dehydratase [Candidatus Zapsychrus exili]